MSGKDKFTTVNARLTWVILLVISTFSNCSPDQEETTSVLELDNAIFKNDHYWRGADGAATVELSSGKILWLFSDTFIDINGTGKRSKSNTMIRNSVAIQESNSLNSKLTFYFKGTEKQPDDFFKLPGKNWFWTGHGIQIQAKLVIFLIEETSVNTEMGFEAIGWQVALIDNFREEPDQWIINYLKGPETFGVIVGSSAVLQDENYVYAFGVQEPSTHETYLFRLDKSRLINGDLSNLEWWVNGWTSQVDEAPESSSLFIGQTEFSVHYDQELKSFIQIQTYGFGKASIGYRLADQLYGPWSDPIIFYNPPLKEEKEFVYTANAHPEIKSDGLIITYNINHTDFSRLIDNEEIYFPKMIELKIVK